MGVPLAEDNPHAAAAREVISRVKKWKGKGKEKHFEGWGATPALQKLHDLAVWLRNSTAHSDLWLKAVGITLGIDNDTRWTSWYQVINKAMKKKDQIVLFLHEHAEALDRNILTSNDWETLEQTHVFLQFFASSTLIVEGDKASLHRSLYTMDAILSFFEEQKVYIINPYSCSMIAN